MSKSRQEQGKNSPAVVAWLYGPWLDLVVGCGAWSIPLLLLSYSAVASSTRAWSVAFYALALLFNYPHYMATIYRAYHREEDFHKYRVFTVYTTGVILLTLFLSHFWLGMLPWIFTLYLTWSPWHYSGQNYGLFMMFARRAGANPGKPERRALYGAFITSYLVLFLGFHTGASSDPLFISLGIPPAVGRWGQIGLGAVFLALSAYGWLRLLRAVGWRRLLPCLTLFSSQFLWFLLPAAMALFKGMQIPQSRYSTGVLAVMHSAQYLWITSYYARREAKGVPGRSWRPAAYFAVLVAGGIALFVPGPWLASRIFHHDFTASFLIFTALVNLHHFILDGAIWKLRDGRVASLLLNSRDGMAHAASEARGRLSATRSWVSGASASARALRLSAAALLLVWGTVDQARYYLALHSESVRDLQRAVLLDSFDSPLQMRLARRELEEGHPQQAERAWRKAIQSNPADPAPQQALLRFLVEQNRFDEAYKVSDEYLSYFPKDANLWMDHGLLALRRGSSEEAIQSWNRAIAIDPSQTLAHLYLASELDHEGNAQAAARHYEVALNRIAEQPPAKRPAPEQVIAIVLRMADCQARASRTDEAVHSYELAAKLAAQTKQATLESIADVNEAAIQADAGKLDEALELYQRALQLDESVSDRTSSAEDWLAYGRFLEKSGFPVRLVYACFEKSASLQDSLPDESQRRYLTDARNQAERRLGAAAVAIRRDPTPTLHQALTLRR
ncbi:MAG TPA: tetratricopeptide repeat protein [Candidatus Eremiobacteraceae bacterium]|nr:tetratricopeptide repeat protein [Candidatus Eremiobacteraceae bacterium]